MQRKLNRKLAAIAFGIAAMAAVSTALMAGSGAAAEKPAVHTNGAPPIEIVGAGNGPSDLAVLHQATQSSVAALPDGVQHVIAREISNVNSGGVGAIGSTMLGLDGSVFFAEVGEMLCVIQGSGDPGYSYGCWSLSEAASGEAYIASPRINADGSFSESRIKVIGIAPNGTSAITVDTGANGRGPSQLAVSSNLWTTELDPVATEVFGITKSGQVAYQFKLPLDALAQSSG